MDTFTLQKQLYICVTVLNVVKATFSNSRLDFNVLRNYIYRKFETYGGMQKVVERENLANLLLLRTRNDSLSL